MQLAPLVEQFVLHFGEMGSRWGVNRTVGQIYALLYLSDKPLCADDIAEALQFSRSNVGIGIKELQSWRLIKLIHLPGDRRDFFEPPKDVWDIFRTLIEERRKREIEPTLSMLREALLNAPQDAKEAQIQDKMRQMHDLIELSSNWINDVQRLTPETATKLMQLGSKAQRILEFWDKLGFSKKD